MHLKDYLFCDDIRNEQGNKVSLMGVFGDRIILNSLSGGKIDWPVSMRLAIFLRIEFEKEEKRPDSFQFELTLNGNKLVELAGKMKIEDSTNISNVAIRGEGLPLELGEIGFKLSLTRENKEVFRKEIEKAVIVDEAKN